MDKFLVFRSKKNRQWYFRLVARNGKTRLQSEGYHRCRGAVRGAEGIRRTAAGAQIIISESKS